MQFVLNPQHTQTIAAQVVTIPDNPTFTFMDSPKLKRVTVHIDGTQVAFILWQGAAYDAEGDYTQAQINEAVTAYLQAHVASTTSTTATTPAPASAPAVSPAPAATTPAPASTATATPAPSTTSAPATAPATSVATPAPSS